jgi:hypothetical protein
MIISRAVRSASAWLTESDLMGLPPKDPHDDENEEDEEDDEPAAIREPDE